MKAKIKFLNRPESESIVSKLSASAVRLARNKDFWWGIVFLAILLLLFGTRTEIPIPDYNVGDIAHSTVRAPRDIQVPDILTTDKKRKEAQQRILPVYDYEASLASSSTSRLHEIFNYIRNQQHAKIKNHPQKLTEDIRSRWKVPIDPSFVWKLSKEENPNRFEKYLMDQLKKAMAQYIVTSREVLFEHADKGLIVRNRLTGKEEELPVTSIQDLRSMQEIMKTEMQRDAWNGNEELGDNLDLLSSLLVPTIYFNSAETQSRRQAAESNSEPVFYQIKKGKVIVRDGEEVTPAIQAQLKAIRDAVRPGPPIRYTFGILILLIIYLISLKKYLNVHQYSEIKLRNKALFQMCGLVLLVHMVLVKLGFLVASSLSVVFSFGPLSQLLPYQVAIPFAMGALLLSILTDKPIATLYSLVFAVLVGVLTRGDFYLAFYCLVSGIAAAFSIKRYYQRSALLRSCLWIWLANLLTVFIIHLLQETPLVWSEIGFHAICTFISAMLSAAIASVLSPLLEWWFNITTDIKLLELSNLDLPVLRQLALEAPGTYHHSIVMGTIAEAAAEKVGANPLFLRVSALYHDIGKIRKSEYYVENQREFNKHDTLNPRMSALVIINHVKEGLEVAKMLRIPSEVADMIPQHHGTRLITYFYKKAKDMENPELEEVKEEDYRYPGPKPQTKEGAILMLADATEAASRTLTEPSPARIRNMVNTLFRAIFEDGQLDESNLTMKDLNLIADAFVRKLESVFHHRIAYPGYEFNKDDTAKASGESQELPEKMAN
jgi:cyclic-di-AMP phosphodiesterase PgpH